jgi:hypothetical protein
MASAAPQGDRLFDINNSRDFLLQGDAAVWKRGKNGISNVASSWQLVAGADLGNSRHGPFAISYRLDGH